MIGPFLTQNLRRIRHTVNELGAIVVTAEILVPCRLEKTSVRLAGQHGERYQDVYRIFAARGADVIVNDRVIIDGISGSGTAPPEWVVKRVFEARGFAASHLEIDV